MRKEWVVVVQSANPLELVYDQFISRVVSYNRAQLHTTLDVDRAHKYRSKKTADVAATAFGGIVEKRV